MPRSCLIIKCGGVVAGIENTNSIIPKGNTYGSVFIIKKNGSVFLGMSDNNRIIDNNR